MDDNRSGGGYAYRASKSALNIVNKSLSIDLAPDNVTCTLLHPGYVMTGGGARVAPSAGAKSWRSCCMCLKCAVLRC